MTIMFRGALICSVLAMAGCEMSSEELLAGEEEVWAEEAVGPITLSNRTPLGLTSTDTNLFWTSLEVDGLGRNVAVVWASSKSGGEIPLHTYVTAPSETSFYQFDGITMSPSDPSNLFVVYNYSVDGFTGSYILRLGAAGGPVTTIGASDFVYQGDIESVGTHVFWSDPSSVYRVPAGGGVQMAFVQPGSPRLAQDATYLYYAQGTAIRRVHHAGGPIQAVATASAPVTALHVQPLSGLVVWGEQGGAVRAVASPGAPVVTHQAPIAGRVVTSVGSGNARILWSDCLADRSDCAVRALQGGATTVIAAGASGVRNLEWDVTSVYWGQDGGLMKYVF